MSKRPGLTPQTSLVCRGFATLQPDAPNIPECSHTTARVYFMFETGSTRAERPLIVATQRITPRSLTTSHNAERLSSMYIVNVPSLFRLCFRYDRSQSLDDVKRGLRQALGAAHVSGQYNHCPRHDRRGDVVNLIGYEGFPGIIQQTSAQAGIHRR
jgi:hypothetical protein